MRLSRCRSRQRRNFCLVARQHRQPRPRPYTRCLAVFFHEPRCPTRRSTGLPASCACRFPPRFALRPPLTSTLERMDSIKEYLLSPFKKECPHCGVLVDVRTLPRVPRSEKPRWYQLTPGPHLACPACSGFVVSTIGNSLLLVLPVSSLVGLLLASIYLPKVKSMLESIPGFPYSVALLMVLIAWYAQRRATLRQEATNI